MKTMLFIRHFCSSTTSNLSKKPSRYKKVVLVQAQQAITDYLHSTRSIPYAHADQIAKNSLLTLTNLISKLGSFTPSSFPKTLDKFLRYNPINEYELFFESIGIHHAQLPALLPNDKFFFSEDGSFLDAACALYEFGFPWDKLGLLYMESSSVFKRSGSELKGRLCGLKMQGFTNVQVVGICLAFPFVFCEQEGGEFGGRIDGLLNDLKLVFLDFDLAGSVEGNAGTWYEVCRKIKMFYDLSKGNEGEIGELIGRNKGVIVEHGEEVLLQKAEYFCRFGIKKEEVARLILQGSELLKLDLETPVINVLKLLKHFGMSSKDIEDVKGNYAHVLGTSKMAYLPNVMRALGLHEWFFNKIKDGNHHLLVSYVTSYPNESHDKAYQSGLKTIKVSRTPTHNMSKLNFLHAMGFGENALTLKIFTNLHGPSCELQKRFDCYLRSGVEFSKLCKQIRIQPKILSQNPENIENKINFLCQEMGYSVELLDSFPAFLCFNLENRIKPRYRFYMWVMEKGLLTKNYSIATMIATSNKDFVGRIFKIHPAAPKHWFEQFYPRKLLG
ncbi:transcription termination factor MTEF18, mitochondrial-like [Lotus japonicus]|uniref:transcription termination factor MTEF18, mitochondrial-like n=1 Tax=Lotus japonicus TaxID=34305 RepID=UPI00258B9276|nr:transcription termination factor MTEF18, mitochondrial-like [Lotus japonicus]